MSKDHFRQTDQDNASKNCYGIKRRDVLLSGGSVIAATAFIGEALVIAANNPANVRYLHYKQWSCTDDTLR